MPEPRTDAPATRPKVRSAIAPEWGLVAGLLAVLLVIYALDPYRPNAPIGRNGASFFTPISQKQLLHQVARFGVISVGAALVIIAGGIDLSTGAVIALASVVSTKLVTEWLPGARASGAPPSDYVVAAAIGLTLLMGLSIGLMHAGMINRLKLPPFIATLATMSGLRSLAAIISENRSINVPFMAYRAWGRDPYYTLPVFAAVAIAASVMMGMTVLGRHMYALGGNESAARLSGLPIRRLKAIAYGLSGLLAALGGILFTGQSGQGQATMGVSYELFAITAAVVGGCSLSGGVGSIRGTVLGLVLIQVVIKGTGLVVKGIDSTQVEGLILGIVVVLAVALNQGAINPKFLFRLARSLIGGRGAA